KRAYCLKIQPATGSFARNLIYSTKPCMFIRALFEYGASSPAIREQCSRFKSLLWQFFRDILLQVLKPEPAERVAMMMVMLIDGAIAAQQAESAECREIPPGVTAWSAAKALIYSEGGTL
ncbi:hypothetical protein RAH30_25190, partial [Klebsiella pneumoniae]